MGYVSKFKVKESLDFLEKSYSKSNSHSEKLRIKCLIFSVNNDEKSQEAIASHLCISQSTLTRWYREYLDKGFDYFITENRKGGNNQKTILPSIHESLEEKLSDSANPLRGYWEAVEWIKENHNEEINYHTVRAYLKKHFGSKLKAPRKSHYKKDPEAVESFKKNSPNF